MDPKYFGLVELLLVGAIALGLGAWQLWSLKKLERDRDRDG